MNLRELLSRNKQNFGRIIEFQNSNFFIFDLENIDEPIDFENPEEFGSYLNRLLVQHNAQYGIGGYFENRQIYKSNIFSKNIITGTTGKRTIHVGIDIWMPAGTEIYVPMAGKIHSFRNNEGNGDYGPTIIIEHELEGTKFYTLYGHLSSESLENKQEGQIFETGQLIGKVGKYPENGNWPTHLHFQIIKDMNGMKGDFPGVISVEDLEIFRELCPDPNIILGIEGI